jgi:multidrug efflux pump
MSPPEFNAIGWFVRRPVATFLLAFGLAVFGAVAWYFLPVASLPEVEYPVIDVEANFPGASAATMASAVAAPLERKFSTINGLVQMDSNSTAGASVVRLRFALGRSIDAAAADVQSAIANAAGDLPRDMPAPPSFYKENPADRPIVALAFTSDVMPITKVNYYADTVFVRRIDNLPGVSRARIANEQKYAVRINFNPSALADRGLAPEDVRHAVERASINRPKGTIAGSETAATIDANDQLFDANAFGRIVVAYRNGAAVHLSDVATVEDGAENEESFGSYDGKPAIVVGVRKSHGANVVETVDHIMQSLELLKKSLPPAIHLNVITERAETIRNSLRDVEWTMAVTVVLVTLVIFLFLRNITATAIPAVTVPLSVLGTFAIMYFLGYTLDNLSLMALIISVGFVVDDSIVVVENIYRHLENGESYEQAAINGTRQVAFTILSITISLIAVFIPIFFMGGLVGRLFREFSITVSIAILISAVVALTLSPMMAGRLLRGQAGNSKRRPGAFERFSVRIYDCVDQLYEKSLSWALRHRNFVLACFLALLALTGVLYSIVPKGFFPAQDNGRMYGIALAAPGTPFAQTKALIEEITPILRADPDVYSVTSYADGGNAGSFYINLKPRDQRGTDIYGVVSRIKAATKRITGLKLFIKPEPEIVTGTDVGRTEYLYTLIDSDLSELEAWAPVLEAKLKAVPGLVDVSLDREAGVPSAKVTINRDMAARLGVDLQSIDDTLYDAFGERRVAEIFTDADQYYAILRIGKEFQADLAALESIHVGGRDGRQVPLSAFARYEPSVADAGITHRGQFPSETISFNIEKGLSIGEAVARIHALERTISMPQNLQVTFEGAAKEFEESLASEPWLIAGATLVVYIVLGILYESIVHPVTILSSLPSAGLGSLLALMVTHTNLDVMGLIGIILLIGIVKKNAIMMVDFAIQAERDGKSPEEAIRSACLVRFRPIMMTSLAAIFGAIPLALGGGAGAELRHPLGISIVGGLLVSQLLTLYTTPVLHLQLRYLTQSILVLAQRLGSGSVGERHPKRSKSENGSRAAVLSER